MVASIVMSAFYPASSGKTALSKASTNGPVETLKVLKYSPKQICTPKFANKAVPNNVAVTVEPKKADLCTLYNEQPGFTLLDSKQRGPDMPSDPFGFGRMLPDGRVFNQNFLIRSYEVGADQTTSIQTLMNHLQETSLNHGRLTGLLNDGFGATPEMSKRNLIWVFSKMQLLVDHYPSWGDIIEVETWIVATHGKNAIRREWHMRDYNSGQTVLRGTSVMVMMNKLTRKLAKIPEEVREEIEPYFVERMPIINEDEHNISNIEDLDVNNAKKHLIKGLTPKWGDLDPNQHVNNVKYIGWILESAPTDIPEKQDLAGMTLEYRRECMRDDVIQSLTTVYSDGADSTRLNSTLSVHCDHLLSLESGATIVKACTTWRPKRASNQGVDSSTHS